MKGFNYLCIVITSTNEIGPFIVPFQAMCSGEHMQRRNNYRSTPMIRSTMSSYTYTGLRILSKNKMLKSYNNSIPLCIKRFIFISLVNSINSDVRNWYSKNSKKKRNFKGSAIDYYKFVIRKFYLELIYFHNLIM